MTRLTTYGDLKVLRKKHEPVTKKFFLMLADVHEFDERKRLIKKYENCCNVQFYSDGIVTVNDEMVT